LVTSYGSSCIISVTRSGLCRVTTFLIESSERGTQKNAWFRSFGQLTESTVFFMFRKVQCTIQRSSLRSLFPVWLRILHQRIVARYWKDAWSVWTTHVPHSSLWFYFASAHLDFNHWLFFLSLILKCSFDINY
jgi:hypothetical protein